MHHRAGDIDLQFFKINITPLETDQLTAPQPGNSVKRDQRSLTKGKFLKQGLKFGNLKHVRDMLSLRALPDFADWIRVLRKTCLGLKE